MSLLPEVESALLDAVRRDHRARGRGAIRGVLRAWLRGRSRGLLLAVGVLVIAGSAAAAVSLSERSVPLSGVVAPYKAGGLTLSYGGLRYWLPGITPSLEPSSIGWCETYWVQGTVQLGGGKTLPHFGQGSGGCGGTPAVGSPIFASDGSGGPGLHFFLTGPNVAAVRIASNLTVLTRSDPRLPFGFRAAVFNLPTGTKNVGIVPVALDGNGRVIPGADRGRPLPEQAVSWTNPQHEAKGSCSIHATSRSGLKEVLGTVVTSIVGDPGIYGRAFLSCIDVGFESYNTPLEAAVLVDAQHPGTVPAALPGLHPVPGHPGFFDWPNPMGFPGGFRANSGPAFQAGPNGIQFFRDLNGLSARRAGNAWLVVEGGSGSAQRIAVLHELSIGRIALRQAATPLAAPPGAPCWISYRPLAGLREVSEAKAPYLARRAPRPSRLPSCEVGANFYYQDWPITAHLSVGRAPFDPGAMKPLPSHPGMFTISSAVDRLPLLLRRTGNAWVAVGGGSGLEQQKTVLSLLTVTIKAR